jgi:hypothetical protein
MTRIFKYPLALKSREMIQMPEGAKILSVCWQDGMPVMYAQVCEGNPLVPRIIRTVTTGENFNSACSTFLGTIQAGEPTWFLAHIYEQWGKPKGDVVSNRFADDFNQIQDEVGERYISFENEDAERLAK